MRKIVKKEPKKFEFSKCWLVVCIIFSIAFTATSYVLAFFDKQPLETLSGTIIETLWGTNGVSFIGYALQNSVRAYTATKLGLVEHEKEEENDGDK